MKWPNVAAVRGWMRLDARGRWLLRQPSLAGQKANYAPVTNPQMIEFINRNYVVDGADCYFQNGPQKVYVKPELGAYVWHFGMRQQAPCLYAHTGQLVQQVQRCWLDTDQHVWLVTEIGIGHLIDRDLAQWLAGLESSSDGVDVETLLEPIRDLFSQERYLFCKLVG